jgi:type II secretory ATPase GspE/PulE/Tfp pilus assembly ATPase PilB-like protein
LIAEQADWAAVLITDEIERRARRADPIMRSQVPPGELPGAVDKLIASGDGAIPALVDLLLVQGVFHSASDVHFEPYHRELRVRFRIDGILEDIAALDAGLTGAVLARLKLLANLALFRRDVPQEGRVVIDLEDRSVDFRVSVLPTLHGEKAVVRIFDSATALRKLGELGMAPDVQEEYVSLLARPQGTILLTGPANSGKTTTLYASIQHIHEQRRGLASIVTVEDPVEYDLGLVSQTQVNPTAGLTFASGLRTVLRQDPEVIMVGEIRDAETAEIAVRAGLTGHLVLSTAHARSAAGVFARLLDMGIEPFLVTSSVSAVVAQRLVRTVCPDCAQEDHPSADLLARAGLREIPAGARFTIGKGCDACRQTGYRGRTGVFHLLPMSSELRDLVMARLPAQELEQKAAQAAPGSLLTAGVQKAAEGITSLAEVVRVIGPED